MVTYELWPDSSPLTPAPAFICPALSSVWHQWSESQLSILCMVLTPLAETAWPVPSQDGCSRGRGRSCPECLA